MTTPEAIARVEELGQSTYWTEEEISDARTLCPRLARELKAALEWQPIETAPKDGTRMQGWNRNGWIPNKHNPPALRETQKVAYALRKMKNQPAALIYIDGGQEETWDLPFICGVPVFHISNLYPNDDRDCPWLPVYHDDGEVDGWRFRKLYEDAP